jgi:hypothetical protein
MEIILIIAGAGIFLILVIAGLNIRYRKMVKRKNHGIFLHIKEENRLKKELEHINVEKKMIEKMLSAKFDAVVFINTKKNI